MGDGLSTWSGCRVFPIGPILSSCGATSCGSKDIHRFSEARKHHKIAERTAGMAGTCKPLRRKLLHTIRYRKWGFTTGQRCF
jgi:hypothetical protein